MTEVASIPPLTSTDDGARAQPEPDEPTYRYRFDGPSPVLYPDLTGLGIGWLHQGEEITVPVVVDHHELTPLDDATREATWGPQDAEEPEPATVEPVPATEAVDGPVGPLAGGGIVTGPGAPESSSPEIATPEEGQP